MWIPGIPRRRHHPADPRSLVVWLTHFFDPQALIAFKRLKQDLRKRIAVVGIINVGETSIRSARAGLMSITHDDLRSALPTRAEGAMASGSLSADTRICSTWQQ
jgi:hypothetical protein